jgi:predicted RNA binding protein YcfA (HicA-like mRNA interferase family)
MAEIPIISGRDAVKVFTKLGWHIERRAKGSHIIMKKPGMAALLSVPDHKRLDRGMLRSLIRDAYISVDDFEEARKG